MEFHIIHSPCHRDRYLKNSYTSLRPEDHWWLACPERMAGIYDIYAIDSHMTVLADRMR
jgi:hypothetical protein